MGSKCAKSPQFSLSSLTPYHKVGELGEEGEVGEESDESEGSEESEGSASDASNSNFSVSEESAGDDSDEESAKVESNRRSKRQRINGEASCIDQDFDPNTWDRAVQRMLGVMDGKKSAAPGSMCHSCREFRPGELDLQPDQYCRSCQRELDEM